MCWIDLRLPALEIALPAHQFPILDLVERDLDLVVAHHVRGAFERQALLRGLDGAEAHNHLRVQHDMRHILAVAVADDGLRHADLVRGQACGVFDAGQRVEHILGQVGILRARWFTGRGQDGSIRYEFFNHGNILSGVRSSADSTMRQNAGHLRVVAAGRGRRMARRHGGPQRRAEGRWPKTQDLPGSSLVLVFVALQVAHILQVAHLALQLVGRLVQVADAAG